LKTAANFMADNPSTLLLPPIVGIITLVFWIFWVFSITFLYATGTPVAGNGPLATIELT